MSCKGKILEPINLNPAQVSFGKISREDIGKSKKVVITRGDASEIDLKLPAQNHSNVKAELRTIKSGEQYELDVTLTPPFPDKRIFETVKLETGFSEAPTASVRVYASVPPHVAAKPPYFRVPRNRDSEWEQSVRLEWDDKAPHKVLGAVVQDAKLKVQVEEKDGEQLVVLHVPKDYLPQSRGLSVKVRTDDTRTPVLAVPVYAARAPKPNRKAGFSQSPVGGAKVNGQKPKAVKRNATKPGSAKPDPTKPGKPKPDSSGNGS